MTSNGFLIAARGCIRTDSCDWKSQRTWHLVSMWFRIAKTSIERINFFLYIHSMKHEPFEEYKPADKFELEDLQENAEKVFKKISCPSCKKDIPASNFNLEKDVAKCSSCNVIFSIEEDMKSVKIKKEVRNETLRPEGIDLFYYKGDLDITVQQHIYGAEAALIGFTPFVAILSLFLYFDKGNIPVLAPIALSLLAIFYLYKAYSYKNYKTYIDINNRHLTIKSRPKNFKTDKQFDSNDIDQVYIKFGEGGYQVHVLVNGLEGQKHERLLTVKTISKAKFLEQEIERYLNIEDRKVPEANV